MSSRIACRTNRYHGFTLVELLVVIGIIAVLISVLMPALRQARRAALGITCASNLRECWLGFQLYANDNQGAIPIYKSNNGAVTMWAYFLMLGNNSADLPSGKFYVKRKAALCPVSPNFDMMMSWSDTDPNFGVRSYGIFSEDDGSSLPIFKGFQQRKTIATNWDFYYQKPVALRAVSSQVIMLADTLRDPNAPPVTQCGAFRDQAEGPRNAGRIHTVHGTGAGRANVAFYDGHVESLAPMDLRTQTASRIKYIYDRSMVRVTLP